VIRPAALLIRDAAVKAARAYGYAYEGARRDPASLYAPPGKFEGQPYWALFYWDAVMDGMADDPLRDEFGDVAADVMPLTDAEREAFDLPDACAFIALWHSDAGFVNVECLTPSEYDELRQHYDGLNQAEEF
jgi:hypothetical protein